MTITLDFKFKDELSKSEIKQLSKLHLKHGLMWGYFQEYDDCSVVIAMHGDKIVAWGLIYFNDFKNCNEFHVYVSKKYRRIGIGTKIFTLASDLNPDGLYVSKWSIAADKFYSQFEEIKE